METIVRRIGGIYKRNFSRYDPIGLSFRSVMIKLSDPDCRKPKNITALASLGGLVSYGEQGTADAYISGYNHWDNSGNVTHVDIPFEEAPSVIYIHKACSVTFTLRVERMGAFATGMLLVHERDRLHPRDWDNELHVEGTDHRKVTAKDIDDHISDTNRHLPDPLLHKRNYDSALAIYSEPEPSMATGEVTSSEIRDHINDSGLHGGAGKFNVEDKFGLTTGGVDGNVTIAFPIPCTQAPAFIFARTTLVNDFDPGSGSIPAGTVVDSSIVARSATQFTISVSYGGDDLKGADVDVFYIAVEKTG